MHLLCASVPQFYYTLPPDRAAAPNKRKCGTGAILLSSCTVLGVLVLSWLSWQGLTRTALLSHSSFVGWSLLPTQTSRVNDLKPWRRSAPNGDPQDPSTTQENMHEGSPHPPIMNSFISQSGEMEAEREREPVWSTPLWTGLGLVAGLVALFPVARYLWRLHSRKKVPQLIGVASDWAMANSTGCAGSMCQRTMDKALKIKLDTRLHGTVCESGAGQEVGRIFFYVGGMVGAVTKALSADDVMICTATYGDGDRHVTKQRLGEMLRIEYQALESTMRNNRPSACFFSFANTAAAKRYGQDGECHGWMGLKFQPSHDAMPVQVILHARLLDTTLQGQQAALGILGTNLIHCCLYQLEDLQTGFKDPETPYGTFLAGLKDDLDNRVEVDVMQCSGPALEAVDEQLLGIQLVQLGLTPCVIFVPTGELAVLHDVLSKQTVVTSASGTVELLRSTAQVSHGVDTPEALPLPSVSLATMRTNDQRELTCDDLLACQRRVAELNGKGASVLLSNFDTLQQLGALLRLHTAEPAVAMVTAAEMQRALSSECRESGSKGETGVSPGGSLGLQLMMYPAEGDVQSTPWQRSLNNNTDEARAVSPSSRELLRCA